MIKYNLIPQEKKYYCLVSVLQSIFDNNGIKMSQDEIASNLTLGKEKSKKVGFDVSDDKIKNFLNKKGFDYEYYWRNTVPFNEIEFALEEMRESEGFISMDCHAHLFTGYENAEISLIDPIDGRLENYITRDLDNKMRSYKNMGFFGLIKRRDKN